MAGFMAGFGSAFSKSFQSARDRAAQQEDDMFKLQYADYISRRDKLEAQKQEDKRLVSKAKKMAEMYSKPEAWSYVHEQLRTGIDDTAIVKFLEENEAEITPAQAAQQDGTGVADPREELSSKAESSVDAQMQQSGMTPPQDKGIFGKMGNLDLLGDKSTPETRTRDRVAETARVPSDEVQKTLGPQEPSDPIAGSDLQIKWKKKSAPGIPDITKINSVGDAATYLELISQSGTPEQIETAKRLYERHANLAAEQAKLKAMEMGNTPFEATRGVKYDANGKKTGEFVFRTPQRDGTFVWKDSTGQTVPDEQVSVYDQRMEKEIDAMSSDFIKPVEEFDRGVSDFGSMVRTAHELESLAKKYPQASDISGNVAQTFARYTRAGEGLMTIVTGQDMFSRGVPDPTKPGGVIIKDTGSGVSALEDAEKELQSVRGRMDEAAYVAAIMDIKATKLAYMYAAAMGQEGRSVTQEEFKNFKLAAMGRGNPDAISGGAKGFVKDRYQKLRDLEGSINQSGRIRNFEHQYGGQPFPYKPAKGLDDIFKEDQALQQQFNDLSNASEVPPGQMNPSGPNVGDVEGGYEFLGGNPADPKNWRKVK